MTVEFGNAINEITKTIMGNSFITTIFSNPIYTSLVLAVIIVIFIIIIGTSELGPISVIRKTVYIFLILLMGIFLNNSILINDSKMGKQENMIDKTIKLGSGTEDYGITIKPSFYNDTKPNKYSIIDDLMV